jgi:DNA-binding MarR family transcriptional regulator
MSTKPETRESHAGSSRRLAPEALAARLKLTHGAGFLTRVLGARATMLYEELTGQADITPRQFGALLTLHQQGTLTLTELAKAISIDRSTLGEMVRRLDANGLMHRCSNGEDGRSTKVELTPKGEAAVLRLVKGAAALQDALLEPIPPEHRQNFLLCLKLAAMAPAVSNSANTNDSKNSI